MQIRWAVGLVLVAALAGCGESAEAKYARALAVFNQEVELQERAQDYLKLLESNRDAEHADLIRAGNQDAEIKAVDKKYEPLIAEAKEWLARQEKLVDKARALRKEAEAARDK
jgi:hypothetical protein